MTSDACLQLAVQAVDGEIGCWNPKLHASVMDFHTGACNFDCLARWMLDPKVACPGYGFP